MGIDHLQNLDVDERIILKWVWKKKMWGCGLDSLDLGEGAVPSVCVSFLRRFLLHVFC
jgi:hypothetical protein